MTFAAALPALAAASREVPDAPGFTRNELLQDFNISAPFFVGGSGNNASRSQSNTALLTLVIVAGVVAVVLLRK